MPHRNEQLVRTGYEAFSRGDMDTLASLFAEHIVWHVPGRSPLAGDYEGIEAVIGYFVETMERSSGSFRVEVHDVLANDSHTVGLHTASGERGGKRLEDSQVLIIHVSDDKIASVWQHSSDQYSQDDFWT
jgi:uncharacterized protein